MVENYSSNQVCWFHFTESEDEQTHIKGNGNFIQVCKELIPSLSKRYDDFMVSVLVCDRKYLFVDIPLYIYALF